MQVHVKVALAAVVVHGGTVGFTVQPLECRARVVHLLRCVCEDNLGRHRVCTIERVPLAAMADVQLVVGVDAREGTPISIWISSPGTV